MKGFADVCAVIHYLYFLPLTICSINASKDHNDLTTAQLCAKPLLTVQFFHQQGSTSRWKHFQDGSYVKTQTSEFSILYSWGVGFHSCGVLNWSLDQYSLGVVI